MGTTFFIDCRPVTDPPTRAVLEAYFEPHERRATLQEVERRLDRDRSGTPDIQDFEEGRGVTRAQFEVALRYVQELTSPLIDLRRTYTLHFYLQTPRFFSSDPHVIDPLDSANQEVVGIVGRIPLIAFHESTLRILKVSSPASHGRIEIRQGDARYEQCLTLDFVVEDDGSMLEVDHMGHAVEKLLKLFVPPGPPSGDQK